ncbi:MAG: TIGR02206 family membrane protein [Phycisphaerae bacterium]|nr:TIGR02206 family membrane protein [Phycisphaerae bacterium]
MLARGTFVLFSPEHNGALAAIAAVTIGLIVLLRRSVGRPTERRTRWTAASVVTLLTVGGAVFQQVYEIATGTWTLEDSLPLHVCSIGVYVVALAIVFACRDAMPGPATQRLYELTYFWGLGGTLQAILTPDVTGHFPSPSYFYYFAAHGGIVSGALVLTFGFRMRPRPGSWKWIWVVTLCLAIVIFIVDGLIGANYMYLWGPPENASIIDLLGPWPWSLLPLAALGTALIFICYSPWWLVDCIRARRAA